MLTDVHWLYDHRHWHRYSLSRLVRKLPGHSVLARFSRETGSNFKAPPQPKTPPPTSPSCGQSPHPDPHHRHYYHPERHGEDQAASLTACCCHGNSIFQKPPSLGLYTIKNGLSWTRRREWEASRADVHPFTREASSPFWGFFWIFFFCSADPYSLILTVIWLVRFTVITGSSWHGPHKHFTDT